MARRLRIANPDLSKSEKSYLTSVYTSGTTLNVVNSFAFAANNFAVIGEVGKDEKIESKLITAIPAGGLTITLTSALSYTYSKDTVVYQSRYDQVSIESRATSSSSWAVISTSGLQWDKRETLYVDANGIDTTQYRWRFYNSSTTVYSDYSPTLTGAGFTSDQAGFILREIRLLTNDLDGRVKRDVEILRDIQRGLEIIYGRMPKAYFFRFEDTNITTTTSVNKYNLDLLGGGSAGSPGTTLGTLDSVRYNYNDGSTNIIYHLTYLPNLEFDALVRDNNATNQDYVEYYTILDPDASSVNGYIKVNPTPATTGRGTFYIRAFQSQPTINTVDDKVVIPLPHILIDYGIAQIERVRGNDTKAAYYEELFYGPAGSLKDNRRLTGIALLEQLNSRQIRPEGQPRSLISFRGRTAMRRLFADRTTASRDDLHEKFF